MDVCVFVGPTLSREPLPAGIVRYGPAALGSIVRAVEAGHRRIGLVDGYFGDVPAVWHKEILYALSAGIEVVGAASMGALRAAELHSLGMVGLGRIFRMFRSGAWSDDDEVALIHAAEPFDFAPLSEPMANIRMTLRALTRSREIDAATERALVARMKAIHFSARTVDALRGHCAEALGEPSAVRVVRAFEARHVDVKRADAWLLVNYLRDARIRAKPHALPAFASTIHWRRQFETLSGDVPPLH